MARALLAGSFPFWNVVNGHPSDLAQQIGKLGLLVDQAGSVEEVERHLQAGGYKLLVMELSMQDANDGYELLRWLYVHRCSVPVVVIDVMVTFPHVSRELRSYDFVRDLLRPEEFAEGIQPLLRIIRELRMLEDLPARSMGGGGSPRPVEPPPFDAGPPGRQPQGQAPESENKVHPKEGDGPGLGLIARGLIALTGMLLGLLLLLVVVQASQPEQRQTVLLLGAAAYLSALFLLFGNNVGRALEGLEALLGRLRGDPPG